jgi:hypothetical protein
MYGCSALGILTDPSSLRLFSRKAISILGGATTVLLRVCAKYLPFSPLTRILRWKPMTQKEIEKALGYKIEIVK